MGKKLSLCGRPKGDKKKIGSFGNCLKIRAPKRGAKPRARQEIKTLLTGWDYWIKSELILKRILTLNSKKFICSGGQKGGGLGGRNFCPPSLFRCRRISYSPKANTLLKVLPLPHATRARTTIKNSLILFDQMIKISYTK